MNRDGSRSPSIKSAASSSYSSYQSRGAPSPTRRSPDRYEGDSRRPQHRDNSQDGDDSRRGHQQGRSLHEGADPYYRRREGRYEDPYRRQGRSEYGYQERPYQRRDYRNDRSRRYDQGRSEERPEPAAPRLKTNVMVDRLTRNVTTEHLKEIFGPYGAVLRCHIPVNPATGMGRGFGFVEYGAEEEASRAVKHMHRGQIDGSVIGVEPCEPPRVHRH